MDSKDSFRITPLERIYREVSQPRPPKAAPKVDPVPAPISLDYADVQEIVKGKRSATVEELSWILEHAKQYNLSVRQKNDLSLRVTIALASRGKPAANVNARLFVDLDLAETPVGLLHHRSWFDHELGMGARAIGSCKLHRPPRCACWRQFRERLWLVQDRYGANSAEGWTAARLWEQFEELEQASRPERMPGHTNAPTELLE